MVARSLRKILEAEYNGDVISKFSIKCAVVTILLLIGRSEGSKASTEVHSNVKRIKTRNYMIRIFWGKSFLHASVMRYMGFEPTTAELISTRKPPRVWVCFILGKFKLTGEPTSHTDVVHSSIFQ